MRIPFVKMHGLGNDFVVLDARRGGAPSLTPEIVRRLADRREGIGCDQLIVLEPSGEHDSACTMRIHNADGSEAGACGNAARAVALLLGAPARIATRGGPIEVCPGDGGASVDMGVPRFEWDAIPLAYPLDTLVMPVAWEDLDKPAAVNVGNPHVVFFVEDSDAVDLERLGPLIETDPLFPERANVNVASVESAERLRLRVWERGAGLTRACGTGACASAVAAMRRGLTGRQVTVALPGGELTIAWGEDGHIIMAGPATESFRGEFAWEDFA
jgi:diaminopimelate epimerase